jgi:hypothetical protein
MISSNQRGGPQRPDLPALAQYRSLTDYAPSYGDFVIWTGWFTTWHGVVSNYDIDRDELWVIFANVPFVLFTLEEAEQEQETRKMKLSLVRGAHGTFAVMQHDYTRNTNIWYL